MTFWQLHDHAVWSTKKREPIITADRAEFIRASLTATALEHDAIVHAIGIMPDQVHGEISIPPRIAIAKMIGRMNGASSRHINMARSTSVDGFGWQPEHGVVSFSQRGLNDVIAYEENQREIHAQHLTKSIYERADTPINLS
jgi:putative transposase